MKKIGVLIMSLMLVSSLFLMAGCDNGTTGNEGLVVAEQYRGTYVNQGDASHIFTITENQLQSKSGTSDPSITNYTVYTEGNKIYLKNGDNFVEAGTFLDNTTLHWTMNGSNMTFIKNS